jgi:molybdopterin/thiamine biosynthesis adenylyltransferase
MDKFFSYKDAFSRNLGWLSETEQLIIKSQSVSIAGVGGVGGQYAEMLARLGVSKFKLAEFDTFEIQNFNRQNGSGISTIGHAKIEVIQSLILDINPDAEIEIFNQGVNDENVDEFLKNSSVYLDGLDFFVLDIREIIFKKCREKNITAITIAPVGMGASMVIFNSASMSFEDYFGLHLSKNQFEKNIKFLVGLTPTLIQAKYLVDKTKSDFQNKKAPSLSIGPYLCAGIMGAQILKVLLKRGELKVAPWSLHFDAYLNAYKKKYIFGGFKNPFQILKYYIIKKMLGAK